MTPEAIVVKDLDKFDMVFQALEYETGIGTVKALICAFIELLRVVCDYYHNYWYVVIICADQHRSGDLQQFFDSTKGEKIITEKIAECKIEFLRNFVISRKEGEVQTVISALLCNGGCFSTRALLHVSHT